MLPCQGRCRRFDPGLPLQDDPLHCDPGPAVWLSRKSTRQFHSGRGTQVVRGRSAKPLCVGSIPTRASIISLIDGIAWATIEAHVLPIGRYRCSRPTNYAELRVAVRAYKLSPGDIDCMPWTWPAFEHAWASFLHEFSTGGGPSPSTIHLPRSSLRSIACFSQARRSTSAIVTILTSRTGWKTPICFYQSFRSCGPYGPKGRGMRAKAAPESLRRNLVFQARGLITI